MSIKSTKFPSCSLFHTIDKSYRDPKGATFTFVPENESDGRMYVAGLIPYLRSIHSWYLDQFTEAAKSRHRSSVWDEKTQQIFSLDELCIANNIYEDADLNCTDEPIQTPPPRPENPDIAILVRDVHPSQSTPDIYRDSDSVSTFNPTPLRKSAKRSFNTSPTQSVNSTSINGPDTPGDPKPLSKASVPFQIPPFIRPNGISGCSPDGSISKMSDTASRLSAFETRFDTVTQSLSSAL
jgi:hypothetical protein